MKQKKFCMLYLDKNIIIETNTYVWLKIIDKYVII